MRTRPLEKPLLGLSKGQLADYREDGFLILRGLFSADEAAELQAEADRLLQRTDLIDEQNLRCRFQPQVETGEPLFEVFDPVNDISPLCRQIAHDERILNILHDIYGEAPHLFKDKLIFKPPGAKGYDLHQDFPACWEGFPTSFTTVLLAVDPMTVENGCTEVFAGYHRQGLIEPEQECKFRLPETAVDEGAAVRLELQPGDAAIFGCYVPHRSAPNRSAHTRRALYISYNAQSDGGEQRDRHYAEFREYLMAYNRQMGDDGACYFQ